MEESLTWRWGSYLHLIARLFGLECVCMCVCVDGWRRGLWLSTLWSFPLCQRPFCLLVLCPSICHSSTAALSFICHPFTQFFPLLDFILLFQCLSSHLFPAWNGVYRIYGALVPSCLFSFVAHLLCSAVDSPFKLFICHRPFKGLLLLPCPLCHACTSPFFCEQIQPL